MKDIQFEILQKYNPMHDDYHTGIREVGDIKTFQEALEDDGYEGGSLTPDVTEQMIQKALDTGKITVYSSYPIEQGVFVSPSKMEAQSYAGGLPVYSKEVTLSDIAWIDGFEGQYANVQEYQKEERQSLDSLISAAGEPTEGSAQHDYDDRENR